MVPPADDPCWLAIVRGEREIAFEYLATRILLGRLVLLARHKPESASEAAAELHALFAKSVKQPKVQRDLERIRGDL